MVLKLNWNLNVTAMDERLILSIHSPAALRQMTKAKNGLMSLTADCNCLFDDNGSAMNICQMQLNITHSLNWDTVSLSIVQLGLGAVRLDSKLCYACRKDLHRCQEVCCTCLCFEECFQQWPSLIHFVKVCPLQGYNLALVLFVFRFLFSVLFSGT